MSSNQKVASSNSLVTNLNPRFMSSNSWVTSSNSRVMSSNRRVTSSSPRVRVSLNQWKLKQTAFYFLLEIKY